MAVTDQEGQLLEPPANQVFRICPLLQSKWFIIGEATDGPARAPGKVKQGGLRLVPRTATPTSMRSSNGSQS